MPHSHRFNNLGKILMIEVPAKIWRPKVVSRYTVPEYHGDDVNGILDYGQFGKCLYKNNLSWSDDSGREDIISFDCQVHNLLDHILCDIERQKLRDDVVVLEHFDVEDDWCRVLLPKHVNNWLS